MIIGSQGKDSYGSRDANAMATCLSYLVVLSPDAPRQTALRRAVALARCSGAEVIAFACDYLDARQMAHFNSRHDAKQATKQRLGQWLRDQIASLPEGSHVRTETAWNEDCLLAACHTAEHQGVCTIFLDRSQIEDASRWLDHGPCPLYLAASTEPPPDAPILAAVDPRREDDTHTALNHSVLGTASNLAEDMGRQLQLVCALDEQEAIATHLGFDYLQDLTAEQAAIAQRFAVDPASVHLQLGRPCRVIEDCARQCQAAAVVIGNSREKSLASTLMGGKAEQLLDRLEGDLVVVN
jgi:universal stress protein E